MTQLLPGVQLWASQPVTYEVSYIDGTRRYTESFAVLSLSREYVASISASVAALVHQVAGAVATIPVAGPALAGFLELAVAWYSGASIEADGSLNILMAPHFCGTKAGGIDLTAWPVPGVDPGAWGHVVAGLRRAGSLAAENDLVEGQLAGRAEGMLRDQLEPPAMNAGEWVSRAPSPSGSVEEAWRARLSLDLAN